MSETDSTRQAHVSEVDRLRHELADHDARERARQWPYPTWRAELDRLFVANYDNDEFWGLAPGSLANGLISIMGGDISDDDMRMVRAWFARLCRICGRAMHQIDRECRVCGATVQDTKVITGSVVEARAELPCPQDDGPGR